MIPVLPSTIDEVLIELDKICTESIEKNNYLGIFAYVYLRTTAQIRQGIIDRIFDNNERMEKMDVSFANKYLEAYHLFNQNETCSKAWHVPFLARKEKLTILQHLLMGMNAHINLDLAIAASGIAPGDEINSLKNDFMKVNDILAGLTDEMQTKTNRISWWMFLLDWVGGNTDEAVINFSMIKAREASWELACILAPLDNTSKLKKINEADNVISTLAGIIKHPPGLLLRNVLRFISRFEEKDVKKIMNGLKS